MNVNYINLFGDAIPFEGLMIYPVKMEYYLNFMYAISVLKQKKNRIPDINIIKSSYLNFLFNYLFSKPDGEGDMYRNMFLTVFILSLEEEQYLSLNFINDDDGQYKMLYNHYDKNIKDKQILDEDGFEKLRLYLLKANGLKDVDYTLSEEVEKRLDEVNAERAKLNNTGKVTTEDMVDYYHVWTGFSYEEIKQEPIYKFLNNVRRMVNIDEWRVNKAAELSGNVKFKEELQHWFRHLEDIDEYGSARIALSKFVGEFNEKVSQK